MIIMMVVILIIGVSLPLIPVLAHYFKMTDLPLSYFGWLALTIVGYLWLTQTMKNVYAHKYGWH